MLIIVHNCLESRATTIAKLKDSDEKLVIAFVSHIITSLLNKLQSARYFYSGVHTT